MKHLISVIFSLFFGVLSAGFAPETPIGAPTKHVAIKNISIHEKVLSFDFVQQKTVVQFVNRVTHKTRESYSLPTLEPEDPEKDQKQEIKKI